MHEKERVDKRKAHLEGSEKLEEKMKENGEVLERKMGIFLGYERMGTCWVISTVGYRENEIFVAITYRYFSSSAERTRRVKGK